MRFFTLASALLTGAVALASPTQSLEERQTRCNSGISQPAAAKVIGKFQNAGVVPTLIPSIKPRVTVKVRYGSKKVRLGNTFQTAQTAEAPTYAISNIPGALPKRTKYSFFLVDPDVPNPDAGDLRMTFLHYYTSNNSPSCLPDNSVTVTEYEPLTPASTQQHRYTFLVYKEPANYEPDLATAQIRPGFNVTEYAAAAGLKLVGGNFLREAITNGVGT